MSTRAGSTGPGMTMLRGKVMVEGERFLGTPGDGRLLKRKLHESVLNGSAC